MTVLMSVRGVFSIFPFVFSVFSHSLCNFGNDLEKIEVWIINPFPSSVCTSSLCFSFPPTWDTKRICSSYVSRHFKAVSVQHDGFLNYIIIALFLEACSPHLSYEENIVGVGCDSFITQFVIFNLFLYELKKEHIFAFLAWFALFGNLFFIVLYAR